MAQAAESARPAPPGVDSGQVLQLVVGLFVVLGAIGLLAWLFRRIPGMSGQAYGRGGLRVVTAIALGARERAAVIQVGDKQILVGISPAGVRTLYVLDEPLESDAPARAHAGEGFAQRLKAAIEYRKPQ